MNAAKVTYLPDLHRELPQAPEAEKAVIGSLLISPVEVGLLCNERGVTPEWFHIPAHATLYRIISGLLAQGKPVSFVMVGQALKDLGQLDSVGGVPALSALYTAVPTAANAAHYLQIVQEKALLRAVIKIGTDYAGTAYDGVGDVPALLAGLHSEVTALLHKKSRRCSIKETLKEIIHEITTGQVDGTLLPTGMEGVDGKLSLYRGDLLIISAPTSCGKSALAFNLAMHVAMRGKKVGVYPLEMRQKQSLKRSLAQLSGYNAEFVRKLAMNAEGGSEHQKNAAEKAVKEFTAAIGTVAAMKLHMRDDLCRYEAIAADIRAESAREPFDFIVIDYLQLIQTGQKFERRQLEVAHITKSLKALANELDCVICAPSQVNADGATREAADAENDASALIKIHAEKADNGDLSPGRVEVWKQREGARHVDLPLVFNGLLTRFETK